MRFNRFPDFGGELRRPFAAQEDCADCAGLYDGCKSWSDSTPFECRRVSRLPDVPAGTCGQRFPATAGRLAMIPVDRPTIPMPAQVQDERTERAASQTRRQSPVASYGPDGKRLCECGAAQSGTAGE